MTSKPKILALHVNSGVAFWRIVQPLKAMQKKGLADVRFIDARDIPADLGKDLQWCDSVYSTGWADTNELMLLRKYKSLGLKVVIDYDDLYFNVSPFNTAYRQLGTEEVQVKDPTTGDVQYLWKDGIDGFDLKKNQIKFHAWKQTIQEADLITTTTVKMKEAMLEISGREGPIAVIPNAIDLTQWKPMDVRDKFQDTFRFGWAVSASHGEDWLFIKPAIQKFLERHKDAKFVCIGDTYIDIKKGFPEGQVEWYPMSSLFEYHYSMRMPMLGLDAAIAPLADLEFNKCKSPLKYAEYTAFGWPVIAQDMEPYSSHILRGETGLLAKTHEDWVNCLEALYKDKDLRRKLHFNAMFTLKELFDLDKVAADWAKTFGELI